MKTCAYNTGYCERLCVRVTLRIMHQSASKRVSACRWFYKYKKILKVGQQSVSLPIDALRHIVLVPTICVGGPCQLGYHSTQMAGQFTLPMFIIDLPIYRLDDLRLSMCMKCGRKRPAELVRQLCADLKSKARVCIC